MMNFIHTTHFLHYVENIIFNGREERFKPYVVPTR